MTLSKRIAALSAPDRAIEWDIAVANGVKDAADRPSVWAGVDQMQFANGLPRYLSSIDAALSIVEPPMQDYVMHEAMKRVGNRGIIVGKFPEQLARAICEVALEGKGL